MQPTPKNIFLLVVRNPLNKLFSIQMYEDSNSRANSLRRLTKFKAQTNPNIEFTFFDMHPHPQDESGLKFCLLNNDDATLDAFINGYIPKIHMEEVIL